MMRKSLKFMALSALFVGGAGFAQSTPSVTPGLQSSVMPAGSVPVERAGAPATASKLMQAVGGEKVSNTVATARTPGILGDNGLPSLSSASAGNIAGLMSYCVRGKLGSGTTERVVGRMLASRSDVQQDQYYSLGGKGLLQTSSDVPFDVTTLNKAQRVKLCAKLAQMGRKAGS